MPGRHINDHQMRLYMKSRLTEKKPASAAQAAMSLRTAYRIENDARLPSQKALPRGRRPIGFERPHDPDRPAAIAWHVAVADERRVP